MDFIRTIKSETDKKYHKMLDGTIESPFSATIKISSPSIYKKKRDNYYARLDEEKTAFNNALKKIKQDQDTRFRREAQLREEQARQEKQLREEQERRERRLREEREHRRLIIGQIIKTIIFLLPLVVCILIGWDVFNKQHGQMYKVDAIENFSLEWTIAIYVIFCIISVIVSALLIIKMFQYGSFWLFNVSAIIIIVCTIVLVSVNLYFVHTVSDKYRLTFVGGDNAIVEYVDIGDSILLPDCSKSDVSHDKQKYVSKYTFIGWDINGEIYLPNQRYEPKGKTSIKAIFEEKGWATISVSCNNASVTLYYDDNSYTLKSGESKEIPIGTQVRVVASFAYSDTSFKVNGSTVRSPYTFTLEKHTSIYASSTDPSCLVEGTQITLYDGTKKFVEDLQMGDILAVFNHETGRYEAAPLLVNVHANEEANYYDVLNLHFSNGTSLRVIDEHGLFDKTLNKYVYINYDNANEFVGHTFVTSEYIGDGIQSNTTMLNCVEITNEFVRIFNPASVWHINLIANDMLTLSAGMVNLFEYGDNMQYDLVAMNRDIEEYGLYTYEDFKDYVSIEVFNAFPFKYYKVAIEKGEFTFDRLLGLIELYNDSNSIK